MHSTYALMFSNDYVDRYSSKVIKTFNHSAMMHTVLIGLICFYGYPYMLKIIKLRVYQYDFMIYLDSSKASTNLVTIQINLF